jgi:hypothetical protein
MLSAYTAAPAEPVKHNLSHTMYQLNGFKKSTPQQNRQLVALIRDSKK